MMDHSPTVPDGFFGPGAHRKSASLVLGAPPPWFCRPAKMEGSRAAHTTPKFGGQEGNTLVRPSVGGFVFAMMRSWPHSEVPHPVEGGRVK